uniref:proline-rich protein 2-like n=1 Tax=Panthera onca TaxID=9690 RepID=UPI002952FC34|nr:proline-rich protein 2-like [Panthera onca]
MVTGPGRGRLRRRRRRLLPASPPPRPLPGLPDGAEAARAPGGPPAPACLCAGRGGRAGPGGGARSGPPPPRAAPRRPPSGLPRSLRRRPTGSRSRFLAAPRPVALATPDACAAANEAARGRGRAGPRCRLSGVRAPGPAPRAGPGDPPGIRRTPREPEVRAAKAWRCANTDPTSDAVYTFGPASLWACGGVEPRAASSLFAYSCTHSSLLPHPSSCVQAVRPCLLPSASDLGRNTGSHLLRACHVPCAVLRALY